MFRPTTANRNWFAILLCLSLLALTTTVQAQPANYTGVYPVGYGTPGWQPDVILDARNIPAGMSYWEYAEQLLASEMPNNSNTAKYAVLAPAGVHPPVGFNVSNSNTYLVGYNFTNPIWTRQHVAFVAPQAPARGRLCRIENPQDSPFTPGAGWEDSASIMMRHRTGWGGNARWWYWQLEPGGQRAIADIGATDAADVWGMPYVVDREPLYGIEWHHCDFVDAPQPLYPQIRMTKWGIGAFEAEIRVFDSLIDLDYNSEHFCYDRNPVGNGGLWRSEVFNIGAQVWQVFNNPWSGSQFAPGTTTMKQVKAYRFGTHWRRNAAFVTFYGPTRDLDIIGCQVWDLAEDTLNWTTTSGEYFANQTSVVPGQQSALLATAVSTSRGFGNPLSNTNHATYEYPDHFCTGRIRIINTSYVAFDCAKDAVNFESVRSVVAKDNWFMSNNLQRSLMGHSVTSGGTDTGSIYSPALPTITRGVKLIRWQNNNQDLVKKAAISVEAQRVATLIYGLPSVPPNVLNASGPMRSKKPAVTSAFDFLFRLHTDILPSDFPNGVGDSSWTPGNTRDLSGDPDTTGNPYF